MACGSGKLLADLTLGRSPDIRTDGLGLDRYANGSLPRFSGAGGNAVTA